MTKVKPLLNKNTSGAAKDIFELTLQRIPFSVSVDNKMRTLKGRTSVTPNILARLGYCLSLEEPGLPGDPFDSEEEGRVINRNTLLGEQETIYIALLKTWVRRHLQDTDINQERFNELFIAHMNRGFELISSRIRDLSGLRNLIS